MGIFSFLQSKRQRRDHRQRQAQRRMDRYKRCVAKKGADHRKCERVLGRAEKALLKAEGLDARLTAKGKTTDVSRSRTTGEIAAKSGTQWAPVTQLKFVPSTRQDLEVAAAVDEAALVAAEEQSAGPNPLLVVGGVLLLAGGGYAVYSMSRKPKKKKKKAVPTGARA